MFKALFISGLYVSSGVILGRIAGFVREIILAGTIGISAQADMAVLILTVPDLFSGILIGGAMSAAFVPFFRNQAGPHGFKLWMQASIWIGLVFAAITALLSLGVSWVIKLFAPGMAVDFTSFLAGLLQISLWSIPLTGLSGLCGAYLQAKNRFFLTASGTLIINLVLITSLLIYTKSQNLLWVLSIAILLGALLRWLAQSIQITSLPLVASDPMVMRSTLDRRIIMRYCQAMAGGSMLILLPFIARSFASFQGSGAIASFNYAIKLMDLPYAIGLASFGVVLLPKLSDLFKHTHTRSQAIKIAQEGLLMMWMLSLSFTIVSFWFAEALIKIVYGWGRLTPKNLLDIVLLFKWGMLGLPALGFNTLLTAVFNAQEDTRTPFLIYLFSFLLFLPAAYLLQKYFGLLGIMFALAGINWLIVLLQFYFLDNYYKLALWRMIISFNFIKIILIQLLIFAPIAYLAGMLQGSMWIMLILAVVSGILLLLGSVLVIEKYRIFLSSRTRKIETKNGDVRAGSGRDILG